MSRYIHNRYVLRGNLVTETPISVAGALPGIVTDILVARDGSGKPYVPGTSLAGAIRSHFGRKAQDKIWGGTGKSDERITGVTNPLGASVIAVADAAATVNSKPEIRDGVVIDRSSGAAAESLRYDREVIPAGTTFQLKVSVEQTETENDVLPALVAIRDAFAAGHISIGAAATRGFGSVRLENAIISKVPLSNRNEFLAFLAGNEADVPDLPEAADWNADQKLEITAKWSPVGALMVRAGQDGVGVDAIPLLSAKADKDHQVIPGASVKGVLRSIAERIMRTVLGKPNLPTRNGSTDMEAVLGPGADPLVAALFGIPRPEEAGAMTKASGSRPGRGAVSIKDTYARHPVAKTDQRNWFEQIDAAGNLPAFGKYGAAYHVAVDRWTGGAADKKLYASVEPVGIELEDLRISLSARRLAAATSHPTAALALLFLTLREFARACPGIGHGTTRGYGSIDVGAINLVLPADVPEFAALGRLIVGEGFQLQNTPSALSDAWTTYLKSPEASA